jgi:glycosyl transferase family 87
MSAIHPSVRHGIVAPGDASRSPFAQFVLRGAEVLALIVFLSFCVLWVRWQAATSGVAKLSGDFVSFWTAGQLAWDGRAADVYERELHYAQQLALHGDPGWGYLAFFYPPFFLLLCALFALASYFPALCIWLATTCAGYALAMRALLVRGAREGAHAWVLLLGYPAAIVNAGFGQNGFLSAALLGGAAVWLDRRPDLAGLCFGCLAYKPHLGIVVPLALVVTGRWRCFVFAAGTVLVLSAAATAAFGTDVWQAFLASATEARQQWLEPANPLYLQYLVSIFGAIRLHGGALAFAYEAQVAAGLAAAGLLVWALRRRQPDERSGRAEVAAMVACMPFCTPFLLEYDLTILAVPAAWLLGEGLRDGFRRFELGALIGCFLAPIAFKLTILDNAAKLFAIAAAALLFGAVLRRMTRDAQPAAATFDLPSRLARP